MALKADIYEMPRAPSPNQTSSSSVNRATPPATPSTEKEVDIDHKDQLTHAFGELDLQEQLPMAERMFTSLATTFRAATESHNINLGDPNWLNRLRRADEESRQGNRDIDILKWIRNVLEQLRSLDSEHLDEAAVVLANASRDSKHM